MNGPSEWHGLLASNRIPTCPVVFSLGTRMYAPPSSGLHFSGTATPCIFMNASSTGMISTYPAFLDALCLKNSLKAPMRLVVIVLPVTLSVVVVFMYRNSTITESSGFSFSVMMTPFGSTNSSVPLSLYAFSLLPLMKLYAS